MSSKKLVILDLDGTVNDSSPGFVFCYKKTGEHYGKFDISDEELKLGLSGPFEINLAKMLDLTPEQIPEAIKIYVGYYEEYGRNMSKLFEGIPDLLEYLRQNGYMIALATMMEEGYAKQTLHKYGIDVFFDAIHGASFIVPYTKHDLIELCLTALDVSPSDAVMIGDGVDDHLSAVKSNVDFIGAVYGYGITKEYCEANSVPFIRKPEELKKLL